MSKKHKVQYTMGMREFAVWSAQCGTGAQQWGTVPAGKSASGQGRFMCCNSSQSLGPAAPKGLTLWTPNTSHFHRSYSDVASPSHWGVCFPHLSCTR